MAVQGLRDTSNFVANQAPENWREGILLLQPNGMAPLTALTSLMKTRKTDDPRFHWWEKDMQTRRVALTANMANAAAGALTQISIADGGLGFKANDVLKFEESSEIVLVATDPTADTALLVQRGFSGSTPAAIAFNGAGVNPNAICIGSAFEEGSLAPTGVAFDPNERYNYTQIFRSTLELTRTAMKTRLRTGEAIKEAKREALEVMLNDVERALWFGKRSSSVKNGKPLRTMNGVLEQIDPTNIVNNTDGTFTMTELEGWLERAFAFGSNEKMAFTGNRGLTALNQVARKNSAYQIHTGEKEFGMNVTRFLCPHGTLVVKSHPLWNQQSGGTTNGTAYFGMNSTMVILDAADLKYVTLEGDDIRYEAKLEANGMDGSKSGYIGELSLEMAFAKAHFMIKGLNQGIAD